jgi:hypothetical protein
MPTKSRQNARMPSELCKNAALFILECQMSYTTIKCHMSKATPKMPIRVVKMPNCDAKLSNV